MSEQTKRQPCEPGTHEWEPTLFIGGDPTLYGDACENCDTVRIEGGDGYVYFDDDQGCERALADAETQSES